MTTKDLQKAIGAAAAKRIAKACKRMRKAKGLRQYQIAKAIGCTQPQISKWEREGNMTSGSIGLYLAALGMTIDDLAEAILADAV